VISSLYICTSDAGHNSLSKKKGKKNLLYCTIYKNDGKKKKHRAHDKIMTVLFCQTCITNTSAENPKKMEFRNALIYPYHYIHMSLLFLSKNGLDSDHDYCTTAWWWMKRLASRLMWCDGFLSLCIAIYFLFPPPHPTIYSFSNYRVISFFAVDTVSRSFLFSFSLSLFYFLRP
jgi:hypothetical protein